MSIPPDSPARGCSSSFELPVTDEIVAGAQGLVRTLDRVNRPLLGHEITYRVDYREFDLRRPVYRWDTRSYEDIFINGFQAWPQGNTHNNTYYNLLDFVENAGAPLDSNRAIPRAFVSTTVSRQWTPNPSLDTLPVETPVHFFRYEIYAPGGIWVAVTLRDRYGHPNQVEICFVAGIAPQYIRAVQIYIFTRPSGQFPARTCERRLIVNCNFRPHRDALIIFNPTPYYLDNNRVRQDLPEETYPHGPRRQRRQVDINWYGHDVVDEPIYITAAFRSSTKNQAYLFMNNECVKLDYASGTKDDYLLTGDKPLLIRDGFPILAGTPFGEHGIDCAFDTDDYNMAYIFSANLCAHIKWAPGSTNGKIWTGPLSIGDMFPCLRGTVFDKGIDAAFRSNKTNEAYIFRGNKYAVLNYDSKVILQTKTIREGFPCLIGTDFESGIEAAFASHRNTNEAYLFKGKNYALMNFAPTNKTDHAYLLGGKGKPILPSWPSLHTIFPGKNARVDHPQ